MYEDLTVENCKRKAEQGDSVAQAVLGARCFLEEDYVQAFKWYLKSAEQGNADGQFGLSGCYWQGLGVKTDRAEALKWVRKAAAQGHRRAILFLKISDY